MNSIKTINRWSIHILFIILITIVFLLSCLIYTDRKFEIIPVIGGIVALYLGILSHKISSDKMAKELINEFNNKYTEEINDLFNFIRDQNYGDKTIEEISKAIVTTNLFKSKNLNLFIIDYFNLCSEEYYWYKNGRIPNEIWDAWENGIIDNFNLKCVKELYDIEINKDKSYYGFMTYIKTKLKL